MNEDLVYGLAREADIGRGSLDTGLFPMYSLRIMNGEGNVIKNYEPAGMLVTGVTQADYMLSLDRASAAGNEKLKKASSDEIVSTDTASAVAIGIATEESARKQTEIYLRVGSQITDTTPNLVNSKIINNAVSRNVTIPAMTSWEDMYFVYAAGALQELFSRPNEAIAFADSMRGSVVDPLRNFIWIRGDWERTGDIDLENVPDVMKAGAADAALLQEKTGQKVLDLTGCTLEELYYFLSHGIPVAADAGNKDVTIVGYDEFNTHLLDGGTYEWYYYSTDDSTELFEKNGNRFFVCM